MVDKHLIVRHNMVAHIKMERNLLDQCDHPSIAKLFFTFQVPLSHRSSITVLAPSDRAEESLLHVKRHC